MKYVVFFRNLNLGRRNCPDKALLEQAFETAGALRPASFQVNGTLVFEARSDAAARRVLAAASAHLRAACGLREPGFLRRLAAVAELVASQPFSSQRLDDVYDCCISFLSAKASELPALPLCSARGDAEVFAYHAASHTALGLSRQLGASPGSSNALLEKALGTPTTMRNWGTLTRLVAKHFRQS